MTEFFRRGAPFKARQTGKDKFSIDVPVHNDADGLRARECPDAACSPGFFKVRPGTGIENQQEAFCPYCRRAASPGDFSTKEQIRYARDLVTREAHLGAQRLVKNALGLDARGKRQIATGFIKITAELEATSPPPVRPAWHDELRRDVVCPNCGLEHSVYGLATWCADCGRNIFLTHVDAEFNVVRIMLSDVERRRALLGGRIASKDLENCLEDVVSIHEAVLRVFARKLLSQRNVPAEQINVLLKRVGNGLQSPERSSEFFSKQLGVDHLGGLVEADSIALVRIFHKRHPITHNLGVVDRKYLERTKTAEQEGKEVRTTAPEIEHAITICDQIFRGLNALVASDQD